MKTTAKAYIRTSVYKSYMGGGVTKGDIQLGRRSRQGIQTIFTFCRAEAKRFGLIPPTVKAVFHGWNQGEWIPVTITIEGNVSRGVKRTAKKRTTRARSTRPTVVAL
jgi:hypothetical protein